MITERLHALTSATSTYCRCYCSWMVSCCKPWSCIGWLQNHQTNNTDATRKRKNEQERHKSEMTTFVTLGVHEGVRKKRHLTRSQTTYVTHNFSHFTHSVVASRDRPVSVAAQIS